MSTGAAGRTVLVVDDDDGFREFVVEYLRASGFEVVQAANGLEALLQVKRARPAFVILDVMMPRLGGLGALKRIRAFDPAITVIVVTGSHDAELMRQAEALGVSTVLTKPMEPADLLAALGGSATSSGESISAPGHPAEPLPAPTPTTVPSAQVLVVDDDEEMRETLEEFLALNGYETRSAADGASAVRAVVERAPDVVLLDIGMPGLSGIEALPTLRAVAPDLKIIVVSGESDLDLAKRALAFGAFDYVAKPVDMAYLKQSLETALMMKRLERSSDH
jgi:DNA-binding NtrC family response regulator